MASRPEPRCSWGIATDRGTTSSVHALGSGMRVIETVKVVETLKVGNNVMEQVKEPRRNRQILPTVYEAPLCYSPLTVNYLILRNPTSDYETRQHDIEIRLADIGSSLLAIGKQHPMCENITAFASHLNGVDPYPTTHLLPIDLFHVPSPDNQFTIWYHLMFYDSTSTRIIKCNP